MMAKMKSLCGSESHCHFSRLAPSPSPNHPPSARAKRPCIGWRAFPKGLVSRPSHTSNRASRLGLMRTIVVASATKPGERDAEPPGRDTRGIQGGGDDRPEDEDGAEVTTDEDEPDGDGRDGQDERDDDVAELVEVRVLAGEDEPAHEDEPDLDQLRRLHRQRAEVDPVEVAVDADAERGEDQQLEGERAEEDGDGETLPGHDG